MTDEAAENAIFYTIATELWSGEYNDEIAAFSEYYDTFITDYYEPYIYEYLVEPYGEYVFSVGIGMAAVINLGYTFYTDSGANNIAVLATMAKGLLADQTFGDYTLYGVLDAIILRTANGGVPPPTCVEGEDIPDCVEAAEPEEEEE